MITNTITIPPSFPPQPTKWAPSPSPSPSPSAVASVKPTTTAPPLHPPQQQQEQTINFSPPLIAMVVVIAAAFFLITYSRLITRQLIITRRRISRWRSRRRHSFLPSTSGDDSPYAATTDGYHPYSPYGLDESFIKTIPLTLYKTTTTTKNDAVCDCAVCLIEFEHGNYIRTLPVCSHAFHVDCIDMWLRSHANCPLCRAHVVVKQESPFVPMMCSRIRPSIDDYDVVLEAASASSEITQLGEAEEQQSPLMTQPDNNGLSFLLKRSYSFGFERNLGSERMVTEPTTSSPCRYRRSFWSKRTSPFGLLGKPRVFSFRGMKSPFFRRRGFFPMSEGGGGVMSSRRRRHYTTAGCSSSRLRCGDPEALLSPERFNRR